MKRVTAICLALCVLVSLCITVQGAQGSTAEQQARALLENMTLEQKIGQMIIPTARSWNGSALTEMNGEIAAAISAYGFGGVILFRENTQSTAGTTGLIWDMQAASEIPMLISVDQEGGYVVRLGTGTTMPGNMALGAIGDPACAEETGRITGAELAAEGFNVDFAPVMDVNSNPANPIIGVRSFSDEPQLVSEMGAAYIRGLQGSGVSAALKHFPGHGDTSVDSHTGLPCIDKSLAELEELELVPFRAGIEAGADMIMTAHIQFPQIETETYRSIADGKEITLPATLSKTIITGVLREKLGFTGVVTTDGLEMAAIAEHFSRIDAARLAINAGVDMLLAPVSLDSPDAIRNCGYYIEDIARLVREGKIDEETIDAAVGRILTLKARRGLLDAVPAERQAAIDTALSVVGSKANHDAEWEIAKKAVTLVKNEGMLPLDYAQVKDIALFCSGRTRVTAMEYAVSRLREEGVLPGGVKVTVLDYEGCGDLRSSDLEAVKAADAVIATAETNSAANLSGGTMAPFLDALIAQAHEDGAKIAVLSMQLPYDLARYQQADALLAAYCKMGMGTAPAMYDGETATYSPNLPAAVYTVLGGSAPSGKLPVAVPKLDDAYRYTAETLYPRGYGLSLPEKGNTTDDSSAGSGLPFTDVKAGDYFRDAVVWAVEAGIANGTAPDAFTPDGTCTRAQLVTMLWRLRGEPAAESPARFADVEAGGWYAQAVAWAAENGIAEGYHEKFSPDVPVTREQLVTMLCRFAGQDGVYAGAAALPFADADAVSGWALNAMKWAVAEELIRGDHSGFLNPGAYATRAQTVTILHRFAAGG